MKKNYLYIALTLAVAYFIFDNLTTPGSFLNSFILNTEEISISSSVYQPQNDISASRIKSERKELLKANLFSENYSVKSNPFFLPIKKVTIQNLPKSPDPKKLTQVIPGNPPYIEYDGQLLTIDDKIGEWNIINIKGNTVVLKNEHSTFEIANERLK